MYLTNTYVNICYIYNIHIYLLIIPVDKEYSWPPRPRSSSFDLTTSDLPIIECGPINLTNLSSILIFATPDSSASILPNYHH